MSDSPVSGVAGSARIYQLTMPELRKAERHGKREDDTSKARVVYDAAPVTTTGLDLVALYHAHVDGVFVPKAHNIVHHVSVQFPADLVDGEDPDNMLKHARGFVETVFGRGSIFADRIDRDEKGRRNVDLFVAPKYTKKTKHSEKLAISMTRDLKRLADKYGRKRNKWDTGRALQDALHDYLKNEMGLEGVQRGSPKVFAGPDWKSAEELREAELKRIKAELEEEKRKVAELGKNAQQLVDQAKAEREHAQKIREEANAANSAAQLEKRRATEAREIADQLRQEAEALRMQHEAASRTAEEERLHNNAEIARKQAKLDAELEAATVAKRHAEAEAASAAENRRAAAAAMATAQAELARAQGERQQVKRDRDREVAHLALLVRASDDNNGLYLRPSGDRFSMAIFGMTEQEKATYDTPWSAAMTAIGRKLADALEQVRRALLRLADKELKLERERKEHERSVATHQETIRAHQNAVRDLEIKIANIDIKEKQIEQRLHAATEAFNAAGAKESEATAAKLAQEHWLTVISATASASDKVTIDDSGKVAVAPQVMVSLPEPIRSTLQKDAPAWAKNIIRETQLLAQARQQAEAAEADWKRKAEAVSAEQRRIEKSREIVSDIVSNRCVASAKDGVLSLHYDHDGGKRETRQHRLAELEPSLAHVAGLYARFRDMTAQILTLETELQKERDDLAKRYPEKGKRLQEDQAMTTEKVTKAYAPPPLWGHDLGR